MKKFIKIDQVKNTTEFKQIDEGTHIGILYQIIDLGLQEVTFAGEKLAPAYKLWLSFEFPSCTLDDGRPMIQGMEVKLSLHPKSKLIEISTALMGSKELIEEGINLTDLLGKGCLVNIGRTATGRAKLTSFSILVKGMDVPSLVNSVNEFDLDSPDKKIFETLPQFLQDKINNKLQEKSKIVPKNSALDF